MARTELTGAYMMQMASEWRENNPEAWAWAVDTAKRHVALGMRFSMDQLMHQVRFEMATNGHTMGFKVNNSTTAALARMMRDEHPETCAFLEIRKSKVDEGRAA